MHASFQGLRVSRFQWRVAWQGSRCRATASTGMNQRSSRSHAIFTITVEQRRLAASAPDAQADGDDSADEKDCAADEYLCAKMHLVDLAGQRPACMHHLYRILVYLNF